MTDPPKDKGALKDALHAPNARDLEVSEDWITDAKLDANPGLVKSNVGSTDAWVRAYSSGAN